MNFKRTTYAIALATALCFGAARSANAICEGGVPDGVKNPAPPFGEECDDGPGFNSNNDNCLNDCTLPFCNDTFIHFQGRCSVTGALCTPATVAVDCPIFPAQTCVIVGQLESCEGPNTPTCNSDCTSLACGDGKINTYGGETCDDSNTHFGDGCRGPGCGAPCTIEKCGNSIIDCVGDLTAPCSCPAEGCDDGDTVQGAACEANCTSPTCGDNILNTFTGEVCDDGNTAFGDGCRGPGFGAECKIEACGNGFQDCLPGHNLDCIAAAPGSFEQCDELNTVNGDGCDTNCTFTGCGNGITTAGEECDDSNTHFGDGCRGISGFRDCAIETCGNGQIDCLLGNDFPGSCSLASGQEPCDSGGVNTAGCDANCTPVACGDGTLNTAAGETCDDSNTVGGDGCNGPGTSVGDAAGCHLEKCGNGVSDTGETCDVGDRICASVGASNGKECGSVLGRQACNADFGTCGNAAGNDNYSPNHCRLGCVYPFCGDNVVDPGLGESCDDGAARGNPLAIDLFDDLDSCPNGPNAAALACKIKNYCGDGLPEFFNSSADCLSQVTAPEAVPAQVAGADEGPAGACDSGGSPSQLCDSGGGLTVLSNNTILIPYPPGSIKTCSNNPFKTCSLDSDCAPGVCGRQNVADACRTNCTPASCGDDITDSNETCDDGLAICNSAGTFSGTECSTQANFTECASHVGATCDHRPDLVDVGTQNCSTIGSCDSSASYAVGFCRANCALPGCGDGVSDAGEQCDQGTTGGATCTPQCTTNACNDGYTAPGESCDDGNTNSDDACLSNCTPNTCGDHFLNPGVEQCDDGNSVNGDGCDNNCLNTGCGNGITSIGETCDDANTVNEANCAGCNLGCTGACACGDGFVDPALGETCDDGNVINNDGCSAVCCAEPPSAPGATLASRFAATDCTLDGMRALVSQITPGHEKEEAKLQKLIDKVEAKKHKCEDFEAAGRNGCNSCSNGEHVLVGAFSRLVAKDKDHFIISIALKLQIDQQTAIAANWFEDLRGALGCF